MNARRKTGIIILLCCMAAIVAVVWYCLLTVGRNSSHIDGTFVALPGAVQEMEMAA